MYVYKPTNNSKKIKYTILVINYAIIFSSINHGAGTEECLVVTQNTNKNNHE